MAAKVIRYTVLTAPQPRIGLSDSKPAELSVKTSFVKETIPFCGGEPSYPRHASVALAKDGVQILRYNVHGRQLKSLTRSVSTLCPIKRWTIGACPPMIG